MFEILAHLPEECPITKKDLTFYLYIWQTKKNRLNYDHCKTCADPEGGDRASGPPRKNHKIGSIANIGLDSLKIHKASKQAFNVEPSLARQRNAI